MIRLLLNPDVHYERGYKIDICYSLYDGQIYYFNNEYRHFVRKLLDGIYDRELDDVELEIVNFFENKKLGIKEIYLKESQKPTSVVFFKRNYLDLRAHERLKKFTIKKCIIQLTGKCNYICKYCEERNFIPCSCFKNDSDTNIEWKSVLSQLKKLGLEKLHILGGEPYLRKDILEFIISFANDSNIDVTLSTNGSFLTKKDIVFLSKNKCNIELFLPTLNKERLKVISQNDNIEHIMENNLNLLKKYRVNYNIITINSKLSINEVKDLFQDEINKRVNILYKYDLPPSKYALVNENRANYNIENIPVNYMNFELLKNFNPCLKNTVFISNNGDIKLCQKANNYILGNVKDELYKLFMNDNIFDVWEKNNFEDPKCVSCSKKLMCINCKAHILNMGKKYGCLNKE